MFIVSPSIYSGNLFNIEKQLNEISEMRNVHIDMDDGNFVNSFSFGPKIVTEIAKHAPATMDLDVHMELNRPMNYAKMLCELGIKRISAHLEVLDFPYDFLTCVRKYGQKAGLALNIRTPVSLVEPFIDRLDFLLLLGTDRDHEGYIFRESVLKKTADARKLLPDRCEIWVDGGVNETNLDRVVEAGADAIVVGRAAFDAPDPMAAYNKLVEQGERKKNQ